MRVRLVSGTLLATLIFFVLYSPLFDHHGVITTGSPVPVNAPSVNRCLVVSASERTKNIAILICLVYYMLRQRPLFQEFSFFDEQNGEGDDVGIARGCCH
jgi:hypothetical protein